jgi:SPX domain protein involved in polyphosphate accumulation
MKTVTVKEIAKELNNLSPKDLRDLCLRLSRFKKENKELLTYLLFESADEESYIEGVKKEIDKQFGLISSKGSYFLRKSVRRILLNTKKYIRYSQNKKTEIELLIYFCRKLKGMTPSILRNKSLMNLYSRQTDTIIKKIASLHPDMHFDYSLEMKDLL